MSKEKVFKGIATIAGKKYPCEVRNGIQYIDGKTVDEFMDTLPADVLMDMARVGAGFIDAKKEGRNFSPQEAANDIHSVKHN